MLYSKFFFVFSLSHILISWRFFSFKLDQAQNNKRSRSRSLDDINNENTQTNAEDVFAGNNVYDLDDVPLDFSQFGQSPVTSPNSVNAAVANDYSLTQLSENESSPEHLYPTHSRTLQSRSPIPIRQINTSSSSPPQAQHTSHHVPPSSSSALSCQPPTTITCSSQRGGRRRVSFASSPLEYQHNYSGYNQVDRRNYNHNPSPSSYHQSSAHHHQHH